MQLTRLAALVRQGAWRLTPLCQFTRGVHAGVSGSGAGVGGVEALLVPIAMMPAERVTGRVDGISMLRRLLDSNSVQDGRAAVGLALGVGSSASGGSEGNYEMDGLDSLGSQLTTQDINRLLVLVGGGAATAFLDARGQRHTIERLFSLFNKNNITSLRRVPDATSIHVVLEARVADADLDGVVNLLLEYTGVPLDTDLVLSLAMQCLAKHGHFDSVEALLDAFLVRHVGYPKLKAEGMDKFLEQKRRQKEEAYQARKRAVEEKLIVELHSTPAPGNAEKRTTVESKAPATTTTAADEAKDSSQLNRLISHLHKLAAEEPFWRRHPPLPRDASPSLIRKRTRPLRPNPTGMIIATYNHILRAAASTPSPAEPLHRFLSHMKRHAHHTRAAPNNTSYSICMQPLARAGDAVGAAKLRDEALARGLQGSVVLDVCVLHACIAAGDVAHAREEVARAARVHGSEGVEPGVGMLRAMMRVYALEAGAGVEDAWGVVRSVLQAGRGKNGMNLYDFAKDLVLANGEVTAGTDVVASWDEWFNGIGKLEARLRYGTGLVGHAAVGNMPAFQAFLTQFDTAVPEAAARADEYARALKGLVEAGKVLDAAEFYEGMRAKGVDLGAAGYVTMIRALASAEDLEVKEELITGLVDRMRATGVKGKKAVVASLKKAFGGEAKIVEAYASLL